MSTAAVLVPEAVQQADSNSDSVIIATAQQNALDLWTADREVFGRSQESAKALGDALVAVRDRMPHGTYIPWLKRSGIDVNRATYCVRVVTGKHAKTRAAAKNKRKVLAVDADTFLRWGDGEEVFMASGLRRTTDGWLLDLTPAPPETDEPVEPTIVDDAPYDGIPKIEFEADELNKALRRFKDIVPIMEMRSLVRISSPATVEFIGKAAALRIRLVKASTFGNFEHLVDFETLFAATRRMTGVVTIMDDGALMTGDFQTKLAWAPDRDDYVVRHEEPLPDTVDESHLATGVALAALKEQYKLVDFVIPSREGKFVNPCALLESGNGCTQRLVTTDGNGLAIAEKPALVSGGLRMNIPHPAWELLYKMNGEMLSIAETESLFIFTTELETLTYAKSHYEFPTYSRVLPPNHDGCARLTCPDVGALVSALKRLRPFADSQKPFVIFDAGDDGRLLLVPNKVESDSWAKPTAEATIPILKVGPSIRVRLDADLLLPFLERVKGTLEFYVKDAATIVDFHASDGYRFLLMPMRESAPPTATPTVAAPVQEVPVTA